MSSRKVCLLLGKPSNLCRLRTASPLTTVARDSSSFEYEEKVTHTGQHFEPDDKRLIRFVRRQKEVNPNWAINLIEEVPPSPQKSRIVACDGGGGPLGHPKVYINLDQPGNHSCNYCGLRFYKEDHHH